MALVVEYALDSPDRRILHARAALLRALGRRLGDVYDYKNCPGVRHAMGELGLAAIQASEVRDDTEVVALASAAWCDAVARVRELGRGFSTNEREILDSIEARARQASSDNPVEALFAAVTREAATIYGEAWPGCRLLVEKLGRRSETYALAGETRSSAGPVVHLKLNLGDFGPATYAAVPSLLTHEAVCHVAAQPPGYVSNDSEFAEGLMHWAAVHFFFQNWMAGIDPELKPSAEQHAISYWDRLSHEDDPAAAPRRRGVRAAFRLVEIAERAAGLPTLVAPAAVARLAIELNVAPHSLERKDRFVARVNSDDRETEGKVAEVLDRRSDPAVLLA